jgi:hypothetical protein
MAEAEKDEEIIELTEVVEEKVAAGGKQGEDIFFPSNSDRKTMEASIELGRDRNLEPPLSSGPLSQEYVSEVQAVKNVLKARAEEWMASEGVRVMERVAREMFPEIAKEVLRKEIEKLKSEIKEKE